ncbi:permease [Oceanobacillus oncorhynchi subsp. incaldanensis]|uniref:ABC-2 transporter permease n=1 Tax=Oceanobacillus aidingensis TaxID=645964 RepID=A0ABV9JUA9_9BACI|nr:ABC-2 transporter permease [Oceanobacillus oncorhynchi]MDM8101159.1 ABC-2 transporter permease [Oceanobacillus oncorhynchi]GIO18872.1 permease [Oceanobacillus oncorhynchi subsp. incaldanensis]
MFNLIKKDLIIQKGELLVSVAIIVFYAIFGRQLSPFFLFLVASIFLPLNAYINEEKTKINILWNSLPYTRKEIVTAKYLGAVLFMILSIGAAGIILYIFNYSYTIRDMAIGAGLFFIFAAFTFPLFYILRPGYIGTAIMIGFLVFSFALSFIVPFVTENFTVIIQFLAGFSTLTLYLSGAIIAISLYILSWTVSQFIYQRKVF